jgi:hypothetical protein
MQNRLSSTASNEHQLLMAALQAVTPLPGTLDQRGNGKQLMPFTSSAFYLWHMKRLPVEVSLPRSGTTLLRLAANISCGCCTAAAYQPAACSTGDILLISLSALVVCWRKTSITFSYGVLMSVGCGTRSAGPLSCILHPLKTFWGSLSSWRTCPPDRSLR